MTFRNYMQRTGNQTWGKNSFSFDLKSRTIQLNAINAVGWQKFYLEIIHEN